MDVQELNQQTQFRSTDPIQVQPGKQVKKRKRNPARLPWWREPPVGYILTFPLVALGLSVPYGFQLLGITNAFLDTPLVLITLIIALIWGTEPAVLSILIGTLAFDLYFLPASTTGSLLHNWEELLQLIPFVLASIIMVVLAAQRERGRRQIQLARQELESNAAELNRVNQELVHANQELEKANQLKDQFLSMASHELKTPITTIRGQAQLGLRRLKMHADAPELAQLNTSLERIDQQTVRLTSLVDHLLDLSILRAGRMQIRLIACDLTEMCREVITEQRSITKRDVVLEAPASPIVIQADCERLSQVVINLVTNAVKYSAEDSPVQVRVSQSNQLARIQVHNQGQPIPPEHQANIFEPFYRAPSAQSSTKKGWGLGLAISKQIVERHQGRIWVESSEGQGTTFNIELPFTVDDEG